MIDLLAIESLTEKVFKKLANDAAEERLSADLTLRRNQTRMMPVPSLENEIDKTITEGPMTFSRRDFIKTASVAFGGAAMLPSWVYSARPNVPAFAEINKDALADAALAAAKKLGASYADIRINRYRLEAASTRERQVQNLSSGQNFGFGVRVLINGTWGFAGSPILTADEVVRVTNEAAAIAKANSAITRSKIELVPTPKVVAAACPHRWTTHHPVARAQTR